LFANEIAQRLFSRGIAPGCFDQGANRGAAKLVGRVWRRTWQRLAGDSDRAASPEDVSGSQKENWAGAKGTMGDTEGE
jgi:hypothetical protein